ncbi:MAG: cellulose binding domain-containing protein, partial [Lachnospiraceae bacterium]|nr:cellulose binding domain-containing protein [Lachnospiraceae bacterium]
MKRKKYNSGKWQALLLATILGISAIPMPTVQAQNDEIKEELTAVSGNDVMESISGNEVAENEETLTKNYELEQCRVEFTISGFWPGGYNVNISIENTGDRDIDNWYLRFPLEGRIYDLWNGEIAKQEAEVYTIKNAGYNQDIAAGGTINLGFTVEGDFAGFPRECTMPGAEMARQEEDYSVEYIVNSEWESGFAGEIHITNLTDTTLEDWILEFDFDRSITNTWNANLVSGEDGHYIVENAGYNGNIKAGETVSFGFMGEDGDSEEVPCNYKLSTRDMFYLMNPEGSKELDSDGDGLSDYQELSELFTDPFDEDMDDDGIKDGDEDLDGDGITNKEEYELGTSPISCDSDGDDLTDYEELKVHYTDPFVEDTDEDGLNDGDEVLLGFDPLVQDTDGDGIWDAEEKVYQTVTQDLADAERKEVTAVSISLVTSGNAQKSIGINDVYRMDALSSDVAGLIGVPVDIRCHAEFDTADITFHYDVAELGETKEENLAILWYDEENRRYQVLDEDCIIDRVNHTVTYTTTHFSTYMLVDVEKWIDIWELKPTLLVEIGDNTYDTLTVEVDGTMHMYQLFEKHGTWQEAEEVCAKAGGHLSTMQSAEENRLVYEYLVSQGCESAYIGLTDEVQEGKWVWSNGEEVNYTNWHWGEPNGNRSENYAMFYFKYKDGSWNDGAFNLGATERDVSLFICEWDDVDLETDADGDGLSDYYERCGIRLLNGGTGYTDVDNPDTDGDGLTDSEELGKIVETEYYIGRGKYETVQYYDAKSNPLVADTDGDGISDDIDPHPWYKEGEWVAELSNKYPGVEYLRIVDKDGNMTHGGAQGWWSKQVQKEVDEQEDVVTDQSYPISQMGCGLIAVSDLQLYLM